MKKSANHFTISSKSTNFAFVIANKARPRSMTAKEHRTLTIRIGRSTLTFITEDAQTASDTPTTTRYDMKGGMSVSANLRDAFKTQPSLSGRWSHARVLADVPAMLVPESEYHSNDAALLYRHAFSGHERDSIMSTQMDDLHAVVLFAIEKDLQTVMDDHCDHVTFLPVSLPVWRHFGQQPDGNRETLYGYFHDDKVDVFGFRKHRFTFCNSFSAANSHDALFYLLSAFTQLGMKGERDELVLSGSAPHLAWVEEKLKTYVKRTRLVDRADIGQSEGTLPADTALLLQQTRP